MQCFDCAHFHQLEGQRHELGSHRRQLEAIKGNVKEQWGKLTDDQLDVIAGKRDHLAGKIQETYGLSKDAAEKQLSDWQKRLKEVEHVK